MRWVIWVELGHGLEKNAGDVDAGRAARNLAKLEVLDEQRRDNVHDLLVARRRKLRLGLLVALASSAVRCAAVDGRDCCARRAAAAAFASEASEVPARCRLLVVTDAVAELVDSVSAVVDRGESEKDSIAAMRPAMDRFPGPGRRAAP